ncbi:hypothetical protein [Streptomyces sp. NPDC056949]|uniref:hypothetical protein n=1 Tax=Streptomyces sp. NPDC056949 TaxID=3345976 RepID=UPI00362F61F5
MLTGRSSLDGGHRRAGAALSCRVTASPMAWCNRCLRIGTTVIRVSAVDEAGQADGTDPAVEVDCPPAGGPHASG